MEVGAISAALSERSRTVAYLVTNVVLGAGVIAFLFAFGDALIHPQPELRLQLSLQSIAVLLGILFLRFYLFPRHYKITFTLIAIMMLAIVLGVMWQIGTSATISYIIFFVGLLATVIVLGVRIAVANSVFFGVGTVVITLLHRGQVVSYIPSTTESGIVFTFVSLTFVGLFGVIAYLGYRQIEYAYERAFEYGKRLEQLNDNLDREVQLRTNQLRRTMEHQKVAMYNDAILGRLSRAMIHDLATPVSAMSGSVKLLQDSEANGNQAEVLSMLDSSLGQIIRIIKHSRDLIRGVEANEKFSPAELIDTALLVMRNEAEQNNITITQNIPQEIEMEGSTAMFERIVLNIVINAIEELQESTKRGPKRIVITGRTQHDKFILTVEDNGRGIAKDKFAEIFSESFSTKQSTSHLGFGLSFALENIRRYFNGAINLESEPNKYTKFSLIFSLQAPANAHTTSTPQSAELS